MKRRERRRPLLHQHPQLMAYLASLHLITHISVREMMYPGKISFCICWDITLRVTTLSRLHFNRFTPYTTIGDADLDPLAASPGMRPPNFGGAYHGGTGMFVGPDHPMFIGGGVPRPGGFDPLYGGPVRFPP